MSVLQHFPLPNSSYGIDIVSKQINYVRNACFTAGIGLQIIFSTTPSIALSHDAKRTLTANSRLGLLLNKSWPCEYVMSSPILASCCEILWRASAEDTSQDSQALRMLSRLSIARTLGIHRRTDNRLWWRSVGVMAAKWYHVQMR